MVEFAVYLGYKPELHVTPPNTVQHDCSYLTVHLSKEGAQQEGYAAGIFQSQCNPMTPHITICAACYWPKCPYVTCDCVHS